MENLSNFRIRKMNLNDAEIISNAFKAQNWNKSIEIYRNYFVEQRNNERITLIAEIKDKFIGYINIKWKSSYHYFFINKIPEIVDLNVLIKYRRMDFGNKLMNKAEEIIKEQSDFAGIGVGLLSEYGAAQIMYIKRGYIPDGNGIYKKNSYIKFGESVKIDDDVILYFIKKLK
ncbi:MAG: GNAT family N-acetyltransferase [Deltaproteobacteria bacterium]|jgi:ribosomal protein S18 acetylase RimI-like enzyme|nr:GNAT family N-acetyltransferase [Deltaproteobacteria bacterium]